MSSVGFCETRFDTEVILTQWKSELRPDSMQKSPQDMTKTIVLSHFENEPRPDVV